MGFFSSIAFFTAGGACGIYAAQNYEIPNVKQMAECGTKLVKRAEETYRKKAAEFSDNQKAGGAAAPASPPTTSQGDSQKLN